MTDHFAQLDGTLDALRDQAASLQKSYAAAARDIREDNTLSEEGRQQKHDALHAQIQNSLTELRQKEDKAVKDKIAYLNRSIFGFNSSTNPSDVISRRDAEDRADRIEDADDAARLLARAIRTNDQPLAQAIARVAAERGYRAVAATFTANYPATGLDIESLTRIEREVAGWNYTMGRNNAYRAIAVG